MEPVMPVPFTAALFALPFIVNVAEGVPNINFEPGCRAARADDPGVLAQTVSACIAEERKARETLSQQWTQFAPRDRAHCSQEAAYGESPSYVELLTCLQMARDTNSLPNRGLFQRNLSIMR
jgi:hypothetical protein